MDLQTLVVLLGTFIGTVFGSYYVARRASPVPDRTVRYQMALPNGMTRSRQNDGESQTQQALTDSNLNLSLAVSQLMRRSERDQQQRIQLENKVKRLTTMVEHSEREAGVMQARIDGLQNQLNQKTRMIRDLEAAHADNKQEIEQLRADNENLRSEIQTLMLQLQERTQERDDALAQVADLEERMIAMSLRLDSYEKKQTDNLGKSEEIDTHES